MGESGSAAADRGGGIPDFSEDLGKADQGFIDVNWRLSVMTYVGCVETRFRAWYWWRCYRDHRHFSRVIQIVRESELAALLTMVLSPQDANLRR